MAERVADPGYDFTGHEATPDDIAACFRLLLGRAPSPDEWRGHLTLAGAPLPGVVSSYLDSDEFAERQARRVGRPPTRTELDGYAIYTSDDDMAVGRHVVAGRYEPEVAAVFRRFLRPGMNVLDLGANIGFFTMLAAHLVGPSGHVTAVEPNLANVRLLEASRRANGFDQVRIVPCAAGAEPGMLVLDSAYSNGITAPVSGQDDDRLRRAVLVPSLPVEALLSGRRLDFIKIDIEGAEHTALSGCAALLRRQRPVVISEFSPGLLVSNSGVAPETYLRLLLELGYAIAVIGPDGMALPCGDAGAVMAMFESRGGDHVDLLMTPDTPVPASGWRRRLGLG